MTLQFSPLLPWLSVALIAAFAAMLAGLGLWKRLRGAAMRAAALALLVAALANPVLLQEEREALSTIVAVVVDRSQSQENADRTAMTDAAMEELKARFARYPRIEPRF
ncbi:hypothetical protein LXM94_16880, partial [Rhizobium sp. TRM95111]|nr:hypothetical protein [Rhizobium alarense]